MKPIKQAFSQRILRKEPTTEDLHRKLKELITKKSYKEISTLLDRENIDLNQFNGLEEPYLYQAIAEDSDIKFIKLLLEKGASPNVVVHEFTIFFWAVDGANFEVIKTLLESKKVEVINHPSPHQLTPLSQAIAIGRIDIVELLVRYGADVQNDISRQQIQNLFIKTKFRPLRGLLLAAGFNSYSENKDYMDDIKNKQARRLAQIMRTNLEQKIKELAGEDLNVQEIPRFLRMLSYNLEIHARANPPTLEEALEKGLDAHIIEYQYNLLETRREQLNVFKGLSKERKLPPELMQHILDYVSGSKIFMHKADIPYSEILQYYPYIKADPKAWAEFSKERFNPDFLTNSTHTPAASSTETQASLRP